MKKQIEILSMKDATSKRTADSQAASFAPSVVLRPRAQIEAQLSKAITDGTLQAGVRLPSEAELATQFGVSRNTVREALRSLETTGLILKKPGAGGGTFVRSISEESLGEELSRLLDRLMSLGRLQYDELAEVRMYLEIPAVRLAAKNRTDVQLAEMWAIARRDYAESKNIQNGPNLHGKIAEASGNPLLATFILALHQRSRDVLLLPLTPELARVSLAHHIDLVRAIEKKDSDAAETALLKHLRYMQASVKTPANRTRSAKESASNDHD